MGPDNLVGGAPARGRSRSRQSALAVSAPACFALAAPSATCKARAGFCLFVSSRVQGAVQSGIGSPVSLLLHIQSVLVAVCGRKDFERQNIKI